MSSLSTCFCHPGAMNGDRLILLNEVALGNQNQKKHYDCSAGNLPKGKDSTWGLGTRVPDPKGNTKLEKDIIVPMGMPVDQKLGGSLGAN